MGKYIWKYTSDDLQCPECPHLMCKMEIVDNSGTLQPICLDCCTEEIRLSIRSQKAQDLVNRRASMKSKKIAEAEKFYHENKKRLLDILIDENIGQIDYQVEYDQVAVWFDNFSLCYQDSDMNGDNVGAPHWNNNGADFGVYELRNILKKDERFQPLIAEEEYWQYEYFDLIVNDFCADYAEIHKIADYFECNNKREPRPAKEN